MTVSIESLAARTLVKLGLFEQVGDMPEDEIVLAQSASSGQVIGLYRNPGNEPAVAVSTTGLVLLDNTGHGDFVAYEEILSAEVGGRKSEADVLSLSTTATRIDIPVTGGDGKSRDVFEFQRFILRACRVE